MATEAQDELLTAQEVSKRLKTHLYTIYRYIDSGQLKAIKLEGIIRIRTSDLENFLTARTTKGA